MPYASASATKSITVLGVTLTFSVTPSPPWTAGQTVTLQARSLQDSTPRAGKTIRFIIIDMETGATTYVDATTDSNGVATRTYTIPWTIDTSPVPCGVLRFRAYDIEAVVLSDPIDGRVAYPTRISISAPDTVVVGNAFNITGKLEYQSASGVWSPLANRTVSIYQNGTKIKDVTTGSDGSYTLSHTINTPGTYTLKAVYAGEGLTATALALAARPMSAIAPTAAPLVAGIIALVSSLL